MIVVSACLLGINCRYDGNNSLNTKIIDLIKKHNILPVCPEQLGGLETPRAASEIQGTEVIDKNGNNVTKQFIKGAQEAIKMANLNNCKKEAILKAKSPSCGYGSIYDGSFSGKLINGNGIFADLLLKNGYTIKTEEDF